MMMLPEFSDYTSDSMAWSFVGLVVGYILGKTEVTIRRLWRKNEPDN